MGALRRESYTQSQTVLFHGVDRLFIPSSERESKKSFLGADTIDSDSNLRNERLPIKDHFLGWQCRVREYAMRNGDGRPTRGMRPRVLLKDGTEVASAVTLLLVPDQPQESSQQFRFMALKTHDPRDRLKKAIELLSSTFYQHVENFNGVMTGLFPGSSEIAKTLVIAHKTSKYNV